MVKQTVKKANSRGKRAKTKVSADTAESVLVTSERIMYAARRVLVEQGYAKFSMRRVAAAAGITVGNLNYHFPNKRDLVRAVIRSLLDMYSQRFNAFFAGQRRKMGGAIASVTRLLMLDTESHELVYAFRELWSVSLRDAAVQRAVDDFYDETIGQIATSLQKCVSGLGTQAAYEVVTLMSLLSEGFAVIYGTRRQRACP